MALFNQFSRPCVDTLSLWRKGELKNRKLTISFHSSFHLIFRMTELLDCNIPSYVGSHPAPLNSS